MQLENTPLVKDHTQQQLIDLAWQLLAEARKLPTKTDYSYIVFPMAKAYEGYLKDWLLVFGLISKEVWASRRFRIGRALNPDVPPPQRDEWWLYDDVTRVCGEDTAHQLWTCWLEGRNHVFHYFPEDTRGLTLAEAEHNLEMLSNTITKAISCLVKSKSQ